MKIDRTDERYILLTPSEGMWLTNGEAFSQEVYAPVWADPAAWWECDGPEPET